MRPALAFLVGAIACTQFRPPTTVPADFAASWGCNAANVESAAAALEAVLESGQRYIPQPGWDACDLLAHNGLPTHIDRQSSADGRHAATWWYQCVAEGCDETHMVTLALVEGRGWIVDYVGW
jgi:hypothetical protein